HRHARQQRQVGDPAADRPRAAALRLDTLRASSRAHNPARERVLSTDLRPCLGPGRPRPVRRDRRGPQTNRDDASSRFRAILEQSAAGPRRGHSEPPGIGLMASDPAVGFAVRLAIAADIPILARQRVTMFRDMGKLRAALEEPLERATLAYMTDA